VPSTERSTPPSVSSWRIPKSLSHKRSLSPRPLPLRQRFETAQTAAKDVGTRPLAPADTFENDTVEDPLGLFSPRTSQFLAPSLAPPFPDGLEDRLPGGPHFRTEMADPRSPPPGNERLIMRNIDEFL
jgi:tyrosine-protein phosphatase